MADVLIEKARNIRTREEETPEKANQADAYICVKCAQEVTLILPFTDKNGVRYQQHFRHRPYTKVLDCPWRSEEEVREIREAALKEFSEEVVKRRLRLFVEREAFGNDFLLFGEIRTLTPEELAIIRAASGANPLQRISLHCDGALRQPLAQEILPAAGVLRIQLDPHAPGYALRVDAPGTFDLKGVWSAPSLGSNAVFVGQEDSAEHVATPHYLATGQTLYLLTPRRDGVPENATRVKLAKHTLIGVEVTRDLEPWLKERIRTLQAVAVNPLRVSVILPFLHDPRAERFVRVPRDSRCVLAVTPPENHDPTLEVVGWMGGTLEQTTLPPAGLGQPRFIEFASGEVPTNLLLHWPGYRGRDVRLQVAPVDDSPHERQATIPDFGVEDETGRRGLAEFYEVLTLNPVMSGDPERPIRAPRVALLGFAQMEVALTAVYPDEKGNPRSSDEGTIKSEFFSERVNAIFENGAGRVVVDFDTLGRVTLDFDYFFDQRVKREREDKEHKEKLRAIRENARIAPPKVKAVEEARGPDPLEALEQSVRAKHRPTPTTKTSAATPLPDHSAPKNRYARLMGDDALIRRLRVLRPFPPRATREFAARFLGLSETKANLDEIDAWRSPLNRYIRAHPEDVRKSAKTDDEPQSQEVRKKRHHDDRVRQAPLDSPLPEPREKFELEMIHRMPGETREAELARLRDLLSRVQTRIEEIEKEPHADSAPGHAVAPAAPKSKRAALKAEREKPEARPQGEKAEPQTLTPERAHAMMRNLDKKLAAVEDDLPEKLDAAQIAELFECSEAIAAALRSKYGGRIDAALAKERRKRDA